jgi:hypothetical protein
MDDRDPIAESLERADRPEGVGGTYREARREFGAAGNIARPDSPRAGATILERMKSRFGADRPEERVDSARAQTRR